MCRTIGFAFIVALISFQVASADEPKKSGDGKKPDAYFKITFEAKGRLILVLEGEKKTITGMYLKDVHPSLTMHLADDKKLHDAARALDGQLVVVTGIGTPWVDLGGGLRNYQEGVNLSVTGIRAAKKEK